MIKKSTITAVATMPTGSKVPAPPAGWRGAGGHRCGFCLDNKCGGEHGCVGAIWWDQSKQLYICPCACNQGHTRCTRCGARDVEVTAHTSQCIDIDGCDTTLSIKRANNPSYQALLKARAKVTNSARPSATEATPRPKANPAGGKCICCGEATRGGLFLPGHDARYVSAQADAFIEAEGDAKGALLDTLEAQLSPKLMAKFVARVERRSLKAEKVFAKAEVLA